jgi:hypothetical protein
MSRRLGDLLPEFGVDNLQLFPAILTDVATGEHYDYYAFNVVGLVSAADLTQSDHESSGHIGDTSFYSLAIDEQKMHDTLLFRLAENTAAILVHGSVRDYLVSNGFPDDMFVPPQDWAQL